MTDSLTSGAAITTQTPTANGGQIFGDEIFNELGSFIRGSGQDTGADGTASGIFTLFAGNGGEGGGVADEGNNFAPQIPIGSPTTTPVLPSGDADYKAICNWIQAGACP